MLVEGFSLLLGGVSLWLVCSLLLRLACSSDCECGLDEEMTGVEGFPFVGGDVLYHASPCRPAEDVIKLDCFPCGANVRVGLVGGFSHPRLWEADLVGVAKVEHGL